MAFYPNEVAERRLPAGTRIERAKRRRKHRIVAGVAVAVMAAGLVVAQARGAFATEADCVDPIASRSTITVGSTSTVTVTVKDGCEWTGGFDSWELTEPSYSEPQVFHDRQAGTYQTGRHTLSVSTPRCYQLDLYRGVQDAGSWQYGSRLLDSTIGGSEPCQEETPTTTAPPTSAPPDDDFAGTATDVKRTPKAPKRHRAEPTPDDSPELGTPPALETPGELPFTGPDDLLLPLGLVLVLTGALLLVFTGQRQRRYSLAARAVERAQRKPYTGPRERL